MFFSVYRKFLYFTKFTPRHQINTKEEKCERWMLANLHKVSHLQEFVNARYTLRKANGGGKRDESVVYKKKKENGPKLSDWAKKQT